MDLSLLPTSASEYNNQRTGALFTVRSANSPSYSLTRRLGVRKREAAEEVGERVRHGTHAGTNGTNKEEDTVTGDRTRRDGSVKGLSDRKEASGYKMPNKLNQNGTADQTIPESGTDRSENHVFESRGRTEWRRSNLASRSKSLDVWRTGAKSPDQGTGADMPLLSTKRQEDISKQAAGLEERRTRFEGGVLGRRNSSLQAYNSAGPSNVQDRNPVSYTGQALDRASRGHSLPTRLRSQSGPGSLLGPKSGQSILERIERLYGSAGFGKVDDFKSRDTVISPQQRAGGTFPRRFSTGEGNSPVQSRVSFIWTQKDANTSGSETSLCPGTSITRERSPGGRWHGQTLGRCSEEGGVNSWKGLVDAGTRSLDRARSRHTVAAQIRAARAAGGIAAAAQPNIFLEETSASSKDSSGSKEGSRGNLGEEKNESNGINGMLGESSTIDEDVFETSPQKSMLKTVEKKFPEMLLVRSAASVRNKINQFEALTQRAQSLATGQVLIPRRASSVPTQLSRGRDGVKKSASAKETSGLRNKWEGLKEGGEETGKKLGSGRSLSVDEVGLRLWKTETKGTDLVGEERNSCSDDFGKYSRLKKTLEIPLNEEAQRSSAKFYIDEPDFSKITSPEEASGKDVTSTVTPSSVLSCDTSASVQHRTPSEVTSPVSDDDETPTNTPNHSPCTSPATQPENATPTSESGNKSTFVFTQADSPKRVLDLDAWVAGSNPVFKGWNDDEDEDDDESTQKDEDSNYDSDSGESSVTITSNMSQSDRRSFCVSLSDLCNFAGADYESENDSDEWQSLGRRSASLSSDVSAFSYVSVMPTEELDRLLEDVRSLGDSTLQDYDDVQVVVLHKEVGVGLGFSMAGGVDQNKPITVHKVFHLGVAAMEGSIREGDEVLSINGSALGGSAHWEALRILRRAKTRDMGIVVLRRGDVRGASKKAVQKNNQAPTQTQYESGHRVCLQLHKNSRDLGFSLEGGEDSSLGNRPLTVQKIFQGGPVDRVCPGDEVLEIKGVSMVGMRRLEAWTLIRKLPPGPVDVVLRRPLKHLGP